MKRKQVVLRRDNYLCGIHAGGCKRKIQHPEASTLDHIYPRTLFRVVPSNKISVGKFQMDFNNPWNLQPMHAKCNSRKGEHVPVFECDCHSFLDIGESTYICTTGIEYGDGIHPIPPSYALERNQKTPYIQRVRPQTMLEDIQWIQQRIRRGSY